MHSFCLITVSNRVTATASREQEGRHAFVLRQLLVFFQGLSRQTCFSKRNLRRALVFLGGNILAARSQHLNRPNWFPHVAKRPYQMTLPNRFAKAGDDDQTS